MPVVIETIVSEVLKDNPLDDPHERRVPDLPAARLRSGRPRAIRWSTSSPGSAAAASTCSANRCGARRCRSGVDRLVRSGAMRPLIVVMPDCLTRFGGSQYINSAATGRYADHLVGELVPFVDARYRTLRRSRASRGDGQELGRLRRHACWPCGIRTSSASPSIIPATSTSSSATAPTSPPPSRRWPATTTRRRASWPASRSRRRSAGATGSRSSTCWRWPPATRPTRRRRSASICRSTSTPPSCAPTCGRAGSRTIPVELAAAHAEALRSLRLYYLDCGRWDEHHLQYGARIYSRAPRPASASPHTYEEFDGGHMNVGHRYDVSLRAISAALA